MRKFMFTLSMMSFVVLAGCAQNHSVPNAVVKPAQSQSIVRMPKVSDIQSLSIASDGAGSIWYTPKNQNTTISQVLSWLKTVHPVSVQLPQLHSKKQWVSSAYTGSSTLYLQLNDKETITIIPAYYLWTDPNSGFEYHYLDGVIEYENGAEKTYFKAPALYQWLKDDQWKPQFRG